MAKGPQLAVDIGQHAVKMVAIKRTRKGAVVTGALSQPVGLPSKTSSEEYNQRVVEIIKSGRKSLSGGGRRAAVALGGRSAFSRNVKVPAVTGRQLKRIINYEARQQIPFPIEQVNFDHHLIPPPEGADEVEVMLLAVRSDVSEELVSRLSGGGLRTDVVDVGPVALFNAYMATIGAAEEEVTAIINIGASSTDIVVEQEGQLRFMRSAPNAGNTLTDLVAKRFDLDWMEAEQLKTRPASEYQEGGEGPSAVDVATVLEEGFEAIVGDIRRSLDFFVSQPDSSPFTRVFVCGGTSAMEGTDEFLEDRLGVPVQLADFTQSEQLEWNIPNKEDFAREGIVAGLAIRCAKLAPLDTNVAPDSTKQRLEFERRMPMLSLTGLILAALLFAGFSGMQTCIEREKRALQRIQNVVDPSGVGPNQQELREIREVQDKYNDRFDKLSKVAEKRGLITERYLEVLSLVPGDVWLTVVDIASDRMTLQGKALNENRLNEFISNLRLSPYIDDQRVVLSNFLTAADGSIEYTIEAENFRMPSPQEVTFVENMKKFPDLTLILAELERPGGAAAPGETGAPSAPQGPVTAVVGTYEVDRNEDRVSLLRKVYTALDRAKVENCQTIRLRYFDRSLDEVVTQEIPAEDAEAFYSGKRSEAEILDVLAQGMRSPEPTATPTYTPLPEGMGGYGYYGGGYGGMGMGMYGGMGMMPGGM